MSWNRNKGASCFKWLMSGTLGTMMPQVTNTPKTGANQTPDQSELRWVFLLGIPLTPSPRQQPHHPLPRLLCTTVQQPSFHTGSWCPGLSQQADAFFLELHLEHSPDHSSKPSHNILPLAENIKQRWVAAVVSFHQFHTTWAEGTLVEEIVP